VGFAGQLAAMKAGSKDLKVTMKALKIDEVDVSIGSVCFFFFFKALFSC
jgi:hypothetical protein